MKSSKPIFIIAAILSAAYAFFNRSGVSEEVSDPVVHEVAAEPCPPCPACPDVTFYKGQIDYLTEQLEASRKEVAQLGTTLAAVRTVKRSPKPPTPEPANHSDCLEALRMAGIDKEINEAVISSFESQIAGMSKSAAAMEEELSKARARNDELIDQITSPPDLPEYEEPALPEWALNPPKPFKHGVGPAVIYDGTGFGYGATYQYGNRFVIQATPAYNPELGKVVGQAGIIYRFK